MVGAGALAVALDLLDHLVLRADDEAVGSELVEVGADAVAGHEARGAAPAGIGLVLEGQGLAHLVQGLSGAAADVALANDRELLRWRQAGRGARLAEQGAKLLHALLA